MFYIAKTAWNKIIGYAQHAYDEHKSEIGGMSIVKKDKDGDWEVKLPVILKQEISSGNCELDKDALAEYYTRTANKLKKDTEFRFCWWHSHHNMSAFWSSTDLKAIDEFKDGDFSFALVVNLKEEYKFRVSMWQPFEMHEDQELQILGASRVTKTIKADVHKYCEKEIPYQWNINNGVWSKDKKKKEQTSLALTHGNTAPWPNVKYRSYNDLYADVDSIMSEVVDGTLEYKEYIEATNELNKELKDCNSFYRVKKIVNNKLQEMLTMLPHDLIVYKDSGESVYGQDDFNNYHWRHVY